MEWAMEANGSTGALARGRSCEPAAVEPGDDQSAAAPDATSRFPCFVNFRLCGLAEDFRRGLPVQSPLLESMGRLERE